jgi:hypothetical protein
MTTSSPRRILSSHPFVTRSSMCHLSHARAPSDPGSRREPRESGLRSVYPVLSDRGICHRMHRHIPLSVEMAFPSKHGRKRSVVSFWMAACRSGRGVRCTPRDLHAERGPFKQVPLNLRLGRYIELMHTHLISGEEQARSREVEEDFLE